MLAEVAQTQAGVPAEETLRVVETEDARDVVLSVFDEVQRLGIHSIPTFVINASRVLSGAAHSNEFADAVQSIHDATDEPLRPPVFAPLLGISEEMVYDRDDALFEPETPFEPFVAANFA
mmetsp:Transcript_9013/g.37164  ORF Transcript_9013/g.37164 Transcript_9013/m.37164 type:complete len:120 (+) Transcript_9013:528-887(+)